MICFTTQNSEIQITAQYKFFNKNSRKILTHTKFSHRRLRVSRNSNTPLMFVRAPKHFKAGKQRVVFFNGTYKQHTRFQTNAAYFFLTTPHPKIAYKLANTLGSFFTKPDIFLSRCTVNAQIYFKLKIKWLELYY